jgi:hypothetical protein
MTEAHDGATNDVPAREAVRLMPAVVVGELAAPRVLQFEQSGRGRARPQMRGILRALSWRHAESRYAVPETYFPSSTIVKNELDVQMTIAL